MRTLTWLLLLIFSFLLGSLPFSVWLGKLFLKGKDIRQYGDGNPGAINTMRLGGVGLGALVLFLDALKAALPVAVAYFIYSYRGIEMGMIALAPPFGHAFSPFLGWKGGKALAATLGVWIGLALHKVALPILIFLVIWYLILNVDGWVVLFTAVSTLIYLLIVLPDPLFLGALGGHIALQIWTQRTDLQKKPGLRSWKK